MSFVIVLGMLFLWGFFKLILPKNEKDTYFNPFS